MKRLVLVGGGHCHIEVLRHLARSRQTELETLLISPHPYLIYSGMIPGVVARDYEIGDCRIDLAALARRAGARLLLAHATGLDCGTKQVLVSNGQSIDYDIVSLDVGATPAFQDVPGVAVHAITVKPAEAFLAQLRRLDALSGGTDPPQIAVVGGGAAGIEIALTLASRLSCTGANKAALSLISDSAELLPALDIHSRRKVLQALHTANVALHLGNKVESVNATGVMLCDGSTLTAHAVIWSAGVAAVPWLRATSLATDPAGFVSIDECLRSVAHHEVFAAGDCATHLADPKPKSGVMAVRQAPVLAENLIRSARGESLLAFKSSSSALALLNCGGQQAVAIWHGRVFRGKWVWHWKNWLDRRFVRRYSVDAGEPPPSA